jgi:lantibiotic modifying enzyme
VLANKALGPDLYEGTSGIALFLGYLYLISKQERYLRTATGAIAHALSRVKYIPRPVKFGFYTGVVGVAFAAAKLGKLINDEALMANAKNALIGLCNTQRSYHLLDIISGNAGAIPALIQMYDLFEDQNILDLAREMGYELITSAIKQPFGFSWGPNANGIKNVIHNLTGFAHGAGGIGYSLLELFIKTDDRHFLHASEKAFSYETHWFDPQAANWPDFRLGSGDNNVKPRKFSYATAWCHGAPGIGLTRLRACEVLKKKEYCEHANASISTTIRTANGKDQLDHSNYSLCHGLSGIADILIYGSSVLGNKSYISKATRIGNHGVKMYGDGHLPWPCGIPDMAELPSLMLGLSGIGYFYLRLYDSNRVPSILILTSGRPSK